jgi:cysteine-rich repeat protein
MIPQFGRCVCTLGWLVGAHCTTVVGCTATNLVANVSICLSCNTVKRFILTGVTCICAQYYSRNGTTCSETCGDGYVINAECDDGNTLSGDGCST